MAIKPFLQVVHILNLLFLLASAQIETDTLYAGQTISDHQTLTSRNGVFTLGLNTWDDQSGSWYRIDIWFNNIPAETNVWEFKLNEDNPRQRCGDNPCFVNLTMSLHGNIILRAYKNRYPYDDEDLHVIWSSKPSASFNSTKLVLENNGNLVIRSVLNPSKILWQSSDYPTNAWLPGTKLRFNNFDKKAQTSLSPNTPNFSFEMDPNKRGLILLKRNGTSYGYCKLKGVSFSCSLDLGWYTGEADMLLHEHTKVTYVSTEEEAYFIYTMANSSVLTLFTIDGNGIFTQLIWSNESGVWMPSRLRLADAYCNQFAVYSHKRNHDCNYSSRSENGCARQSLLQCHGGEEDGFVLMHNATFVGGHISQVGSSKRCQKACLQDNSCQGYNYKDNLCEISEQYSFNLQYTPGSQVYYRLATAEVKEINKSKFIVLILGATIGGIILIIIALPFFFWRLRSMIYASMVVEDTSSLMLLKYRELRRATNNFSCKLGEGGCGSVFKGKWPNSSEAIAVKHLRIHCRGEKQFRAEVSTIGLIHHVNLVRLFGFCAEGTKRFLIYEYMPHGSLDKHIFGNCPVNLGWGTRYQIGLGIAKGLAYLHGECRECIIHCDIKPENILLDDEYNPKIADFGLAKLLDRDFSRVLTTMRGTRGYLAPEWISGSAITSKADVYSYGMMLFEIISGKRNWSMRINGENDYIPLQVMQTLLSEGEVISLLDSKLEGNANLEEVIRLCRVAGWCIQENEEDRPSMVQVIRILEGTQKVINPPIPRFAQYIAENPDESTMYHSCIDVC